MKIIVYIIFISLIFIVPSKSYALEMPDQICLNNPLEDGLPVPIKFTLHGQVFVPALNHINKAAIFAKSTSGSSAKVKLKIQKAWFGSNAPTYEKIIVINDSPWWYEANFSEAPVTPGVAYFLTVEPLNNASIEWYIKDDPNCNPSGYAFVGGDIEREKDFFFSTRGENSTIQLEEPQTSADQSQPQDSSQIDDPRNTPGAITNTPGSSSNTTASTSNVNENNTAAKKATTKSDFISAQEASKANKVAQNTEKISDEEIDQVLKMIAEDYAKSRKGIFGIGGVVGNMLTVPVLAGLAVAVILFVGFIVTLVMIIKRSNKKNIRTQ